MSASIKGDLSLTSPDGSVYAVTVTNAGVLSTVPVEGPGPEPSPEPTPTPTSERAYGPGIMADGLANERIGHSNQCVQSYRFRALRSSRIISTRIYIIGNGATGYSGGDGGILRKRITADDGTSKHFPNLSTVYGSAQVRTVNPVPNTQANFPKFQFNGAQVLKEGDLYHLVMDNVASDPVSNYVSTDLLWYGQPALDPRQAKFADADWGTCWKYGGDSWEVRPGGWTPILDIEYDDGTHQGMGNMESSINVPATISGGSMVRELFKVSGKDRLIKGIGLGLSRYTGTAPLVLGLYDSGNTLIDSVSIPAAQIGVDASAGIDDGKLTLASGNLSQPRTIKVGQTYSVRASAPAGTQYRTWSLRRGVSYGFHPSTYFADGSATKTTNNGGTWGEMRAGWMGTDDLMFHLTPV